MTTCKTDVELTLGYSDNGTETDDSEIVINVGGLSGSGTSITGSTVKMSATVSAVKARSVVGKCRRYHRFAALYDDEQQHGGGSYHHDGLFSR